MTLADAIEGFLAGYFSTCRRSAKTQSAYKIDLAQLQTYLGPDQLLRALEAESLEAWATDMRTRGYASVSVRRKFATARVFFSYWVRKEVLDKSPLWRIRLDLGRERLLPRSLTALDAKRLIEESWREVNSPCSVLVRPGDPGFLQLRNLAAIEILFATGMRVGELVSLRLQDWRADDASFVVSGKGSRQRLGLLPDARSIKAVQMYVVRRSATDLGHEGLLVNANGHRISTQGIARVLATVAKEGGVTTRVGRLRLRRLGISQSACFNCCHLN